MISPDVVMMLVVVIMFTANSFTSFIYERVIVKARVACRNLAQKD